MKNSKIVWGYENKKTGALFPEAYKSRSQAREYNFEAHKYKIIRVKITKI